MRVIELLESELPNLTDLLKKDCAPYLKESGKNIIVRGLGLQSARNLSSISSIAGEVEYVKMAARKDRRPVDTPRIVHDLADAFFKDRFGWNARSEATFVVGEKNKNMASSYGKVFIIFPIGQFEFIWSDEIEDFWNEIEQTESYKDNPSSEMVITDILDGLSYSNNNLKAAIKSGHEIMLKCDSYYAIPFQYLGRVKEALK